MHFLKPKKSQPYTLNLSTDVYMLLEHYSKYCKMSIDEVAEHMLTQLTKDNDFVEHISKKRDNKKVMQVIDYYNRG
ncbi:MAG: hypothetical protein K0Q49_469 [Haloplasmataceae bacterium]|jgi:hypothetical protein|nr:hypothetical protein [Haloplasmataceae bacterium]